MITIVHQLRIAKGRNKKKAILRQEIDNELWKKVLVAMYDSSINYGISAPSDNTFVECDCSNMFSLLDAFSSRELTGNKARKYAKIGSQTYGEIFRLILGGSLKAGISVKTINEIYPGLIPTFDVMLAEDAEVTRFPILASTKFDGVRLLAFVDNGNVTLKLRSGKQLILESLIYEYKNKPDGVYDGELVRGGGLQSGRTGITGDVNKLLKGSLTDINGYSHQLFDFIPLKCWEDKKCTVDYLTRLCTLNNNIKAGGYINISEQRPLLNSQQIEYMFKDRLSKGYEGLILRYSDGMYVWDRSPALIKKKAIKECVLTCYDTTEGTGKYEGMIGALKCRGVVDGKPIEVKVGSGMSAYDVDKPADYYIGKDIELLYNDIVRAKKSETYSLFLPRFKRVRGNADI